MPVTTPAPPRRGHALRRHRNAQRVPALRRTVLALAGQRDVQDPPDGQTCTGISAGMQHSLALTSTGQVKVWGDNSYGQFDVPPLSDGQTYTSIAAGDNHSLALTGTGKVVTWGYDRFGLWDVQDPPDGQTYTAIAAGGFRSMALTDTGQVIAWGYSVYGQLDVPKPANGQTFTAIAGGARHLLALSPLQAPTLTGTPPAAVVRQPYNHAFTVTGTPAPTVAVTAGDLPAGLTLSDAGVLSGTPTTAGTSSFTVTATNSVDTSSLDVELVVAAALQHRRSGTRRRGVEGRRRIGADQTGRHA